MADFHSKTSFLRNAEVTDFYLDINNLPSIPRRVGDALHTIQPQHEGRPDLLAYELYGNTRLWWVFAMRNPDLIQDPINDFVSGLNIYLPSKDVVQSVTG